MHLVRLLLSLALWAGAVAVGLPALADEPPQATEASDAFMDSRSRVGVSLHLSQQAVAPGGDAVVAVVLDHEPSWHIHTQAPLEVPEQLGRAEDYVATAVEPDVAEGSPLAVHDGHVQWPEPHDIQWALFEEPVAYSVFDGRAVVYVPFSVADDAAPGSYPLTLRVTFQACDDTTCLRPTMAQPYRVAVRVASPEELATLGDNQADEPELFEDFDPAVWETIYDGGSDAGAERVGFDLFGWSFEVRADGAYLVLLLGVASLGGFLLNLTPCVLPVIPLKVMALSQSAGSRLRTLALGIAMCGGIVGFWLALGGAVAFVSGFDAINELFQRPWFTVGVGVIIAVLAVGMSGLFALRLPAAVTRINPGHDSVVGSAGFGVMTAVLGTPCTAPFMGAAAAWSTQQPPAITLLTFLAIGAGMAVPYLVLAGAPELTAKVPRTGPGSELVKQVMGLLMLAAAAYFIGVGVSGLMHDPPGPPATGYWWVVAGFVAAAGLWLGLRGLQQVRLPVGRVAAVVAGVSLVGAAAWAGPALTDEGPIDWVYYTPQRLASSLEAGDVVVLEFTAEWCLNCKALEQRVLHQDRVADLSRADGVTFMKVDLTSDADVAAARLLSEMGSATIPLLVVLEPGGERVFHGDFYTADQVVDAVRRAGSRAAVARVRP
jgi:thiol:disulfide interchange protein